MHEIPAAFLPITLPYFCPNSRLSVQPYSFSRPVFRSGGSVRPYPCYPHCDNPSQKPRCSGLGKRFPPTSVDIALSKDGSDFKEAFTQPITYDMTGPWAILPVVADFKTARARYWPKTRATSPPEPQCRAKNLLRYG
ncbi:hypothetical protein [Spirosoma luteum]|uniref:hypothetical protein n=1 Tax=Spirosoma luteum TaxID=431553 RepID=UPI0003A1647D|nr:hypothetical protein [Spirosoma luteum]